MWPETFAGAYSPTTLGVMVDEQFSRLTHTVRPRARSVVTSELSVDLVRMTGAATGSLYTDGEVLAVSDDEALARASVRDQADALIATATTRCRFVPAAHHPDHPYPSRAKPPPDLNLSSLLATEPDAENQIVASTFTPDECCGNDLGTLHGGIAIAATLEVTLAWLRMVYGNGSASSIRLNLLRPIPLTAPTRIQITPIRIGRTVATGTITHHNPAGKIMATALVTGGPTTY